MLSKPVYLSETHKPKLLLFSRHITWMDQQEIDALEFFEEFINKEQAEEAMDKSHSTKREGSVTYNNGVVEYLKNEAQTSVDLTPSFGKIIDEILIEPTSE